MVANASNLTNAIARPLDMLDSYAIKISTSVTFQDLVILLQIVPTSLVDTIAQHVLQDLLVLERQVAKNWVETLILRPLMQTFNLALLQLLNG